MHECMWKYIYTYMHAATHILDIHYNIYKTYGRNIYRLYKAIYRCMHNVQDIFFIKYVDLGAQYIYIL